MFSRAEAQQLRKEFWTAFGRYMTRHTSAFGPKTKWLNYRTGIKDLYFRLHADNKLARVSIELQHSDAGIRELFYEQWEELKMMLEADLREGEAWIWEPEHYLDSGQCISIIYITLPGINIYQKEDWGNIFRFFEQYLVPFDEMWSMVKAIFEDLQN